MSIVATSRNTSALLATFLLSAAFLITSFETTNAQSSAIDPATLDTLKCKQLETEIPRPDGFSDEAYSAYQGNIRETCRTLLPRPQIQDKFLDAFADILTTATGLLGLLTGFIIAAATCLITFRSKFEEYKAIANKQVVRASDPVYASSLEIEHEALNLVLVGEGGSGKTTLIHSLTCVDDGRPVTSTGSFATYSILQDIGISKGNTRRRKVTRIYVDDYIGQNFSQIATNDELARRKKFIKCTALVITVDLFYPDIVKSFSADSFDKARIKEQIDFYSEGVIQILGNMVRDGELVVLFINKLDVLKSIDSAAIRKAKQAYQPLKDRLDKLRGRNIQVIVGSAAKGWGIVGRHNGNIENTSLFELVIGAAEPISEKQLSSALKEIGSNGSGQNK